MKLATASNRLQIVGLAVLFNLFFEYAVGGTSRLFERPVTLVALILIYCSLFFMLEDLIRRFRIRNLQVFVAAQVFGILPELYLTGSVFTEPRVLGINWLSFLTINLVWWGVLQSLITLYFANRLVPRKWDEGAPMGRLGWGLCLGYMAVICTGSLINSPTLLRSSLDGYLVGTALQLAGLGYLFYSIRGPQQPPYPFTKDLLLDILAFGTVAVFIAIGTFVVGSGAGRLATGVLDADAVFYASIWCYVVGAGAILYYLVRRRPIPV